MKKWTIEWVMKRYEVIDCDALCGGWRGYKFGNRVIVIINGYYGGYANDTYHGGKDFPMKFASLKDALKWLVEGQRRIDKKKKKWELVEKGSDIGIGQVFRPVYGCRYVITGLTDGGYAWKLYKKVEDNDEKVE